MNVSILIVAAAFFCFSTPGATGGEDCRKHLIPADDYDRTLYTDEGHPISPWSMQQAYNYFSNSKGRGTVLEIGLKSWIDPQSSKIFLGNSAYLGRQTTYGLVTDILEVRTREGELTDFTVVLQKDQSAIEEVPWSNIDSRFVTCNHSLKTVEEAMMNESPKRRAIWRQLLANISSQTMMCVTIDGLYQQSVGMRFEQKGKGVFDTEPVSTFRARVKSIGMSIEHDVVFIEFVDASTDSGLKSDALRVYFSDIVRVR